MHLRIARAVVLLATIVLFCAPSFGQLEQPRGYVLYRVASGEGRVFGVEFRNPVLIEADASGGKLVADIEFSSTCSETVTFTWTFNRDIRYLQPEERFEVLMTVGVSGDCGRDPFCLASSGLIAPSIAETMTETELDEHSGLKKEPPQTEAEARVHGKANGTGTSGFVMRSSRRNSRRVFFYITFNAGSGREGCVWQIAYLYRAVYDDTEPGDIEIVLDEPTANSGTTATVPPPDGGSTGSEPGGSGQPGDGDDEGGASTGAGADGGASGAGSPQPTDGTGLCPDPSLEPCIQQWMNKVVELRNRKAPDRAPWGFSRYGHLTFNQVISVLPPDGWETKYQRSRYCFVWLTRVNEHLDPIYDGELPSLYETCAGGGAAGGPGGPGGPGATPPGTGGAGPGGTTGGGGTATGGGATGPGATDIDGRTLLAERRVVEASQTVTVPVRLINPDGVANINFEVLYDPSVVRVESIARGSVLGGQVLFESNPSEAGRMRIGFAGQRGLSADGIVANITFRAVGAPGDRTPLTLRVTDIDDPSGAALPINLVNGEVVITGPGGRVPGDCDGDGMLTAADAICALKMSVGLRDVDLTLDANADGQVTSGDAREILQQIP